MTKVNKVTLVERVAQRTGLNRSQVEGVINALTETIIDGVKAGEVMTITGFGQFLAQARKAREGVNPRTRERMTIHPVVIPKFIAGKNLKEALRGSDSGHSAHAPTPITAPAPVAPIPPPSTPLVP